MAVTIEQVAVFVPATLDPPRAVPVQHAGQAGRDPPADMQREIRVLAIDRSE
jgi:hypothetical protein